MYTSSLDHIQESNSQPNLASTTSLLTGDLVFNGEVKQVQGLWLNNKHLDAAIRIKNFKYSKESKQPQESTKIYGVEINQSKTSQLKTRKSKGKAKKKKSPKEKIKEEKEVEDKEVVQRRIRINNKEVGTKTKKSRGT